MSEHLARRRRRLARTVLAVAALGFCATACQCERKATPQPAPSRLVVAASQPASQPRPRRPPPPPPAAPGTIMSSRDGLVRVTTPATPGWECLEQLAAAGTPAGGTLMKCRRPRPELFLLVAKDYEVEPTAVLPAEKVAMQERPKHFQRLFASHEITRHGPTKHQGVAGHEIEFSAKLRGKGEVRGIERIFTKGTHVLQITAEGRRVDFERYQDTIMPWFDAVAFKVLGP
ncbi:MAG: hypothetical protein HY906_00825 [Deltaproteobacteria bacterium]|nr:hypothetical protein [Deltaproteobacteria bacterium]